MTAVRPTGLSDQTADEAHRILCASSMLHYRSDGGDAVLSSSSVDTRD
jgi:hypothetical protein